MACMKISLPALFLFYYEYFHYSTLVSLHSMSKIADFFASMSEEITASEKTRARVSNNVPNGANAVLTDRYSPVELPYFKPGLFFPVITGDIPKVYDAICIFTDF